MGITRHIIFDGINTEDYNVGITGEAVYNAPERDVEMIAIPGRNGELAFDRGRFHNIEVTYPAGAYDNTQPNFAAKIRELRNALASRVGYKRLEDEYNPDEYRMAVYKTGLEVSPAHYSTAGEFDIVFDCKPQRFLKIGDNENDLSEWNNTTTTSGEMLSIKHGSAQAFKTLLVGIDPVLSGYGTPSPSNPRTINPADGIYIVKARKNILEPRREDGFVYENNGVTFTYEGKKVRAQGTATGGNASIRITPDYFRGIEGTIFSGCPQGGSPSTYEMQMEINGYVYRDYGNGTTIKRNGRGYGYILIREGQTVDLLFSPMIRTADAPAYYEEYRGLRYYKALNENVYKGTLNVITGELTITHKGIDLSIAGATGTSQGGASSNYKGFYTPLINDIKNYVSAELPDDLLCNRAVATSRQDNYNCVPGIAIHQSEKRIYIYLNELREKTLAEAQAWLVDNPMTVMYPLNTPITTTITTTSINLFDDLTNVYSSRGAILSAEYGDAPGRISNPTLFDAKPLLKVWGYGPFTINGEELAVNSVPVGEIKVKSGKQLAAASTSFTFSNSVAMSGDDVYFKSFPSDALEGGLYYTGDKTISGTPTATYQHTNPYARITGLFRVQTLSQFLLKVSFNPQLIKFDYGTARSCTERITINMPYSDNTSDDLILNVGVSYDGTRTIAITSAMTLPATYGGGFSYVRYNDLYLNSSYPAIGQPLYFDLDTGEAYKIENNTVIPVNNAVTIPAKLPTLKPGNNVITYADTFTQFKIVPRWWRI